jgi:hypothetical protein
MAVWKRAGFPVKGIAGLFIWDALMNHSETRFRELIRQAENGNYQVDYALRCWVAEYLDQDNYRDLMPKDLIAFTQRAFTRDLGQAIG